LSVADGLREVWRRPRFRRLLAVKTFSQSADGMVQVGVASYTLLSPQSQPNAWAVAGVLAVTMLPFSVLGPFVSVVIDRWDRRRVILAADSIRFALSLGLAALVFLAPHAPAPILLVALVVMGLERFQIATLLAGVPRTIEPGEYLAANTALPVIGPVGMMVGALVAAVVRLTVGEMAGVTLADTLIFLLAALCFACSVLTCRGFAVRSLGPDTVVVHKLSATLRDLAAACRHVAARRPAALGLLTLTVVRLAWGFVMVATILVFRNRFNDVDDVDAAIGGLAIWALATGAGFVLASALNPFLARRFTLRVTVVAVLAAAAVNQALPGSIFTPPTLIGASFLLGLWAQCVKINVDTLLQAHVDDDFKGRVFVIEDFAYNTPLVLAGVVAALVLPVDGVSLPAFLAVAGCYLLMAVVFAVVSRKLGVGTFARGTESLTADAVSSASEITTGSGDVVEELPEL
jgi:MFS family permease